MKVLLIEKLTSFTLIYSFLMRSSYRRIYYFSETPLFKKDSFLKKLERLSIYRAKTNKVNVKGLYCTIQKDVFDLVEVLFEKKFNKQVKYLNILNYFKINGETERKFNASIKHFLANNYYESIRTLKIIEANKEWEKTNCTCFFNKIFELKDIYNIDQYRISNVSRILFYILKPFKIYINIIWEALRVFKNYGVISCKSKVNINVDEFSIGYFASNPFRRDKHVKKYYFDTIPYSYDKSSTLSPSKILHLFWGEVTDPYMKAFLEKKNIKYINIKKIPLGCKYIIDIMKAIITLFPKALHFHNVNIIYVVSELVVWTHILRKLDHLKVYFFAYDIEYSRWHKMSIVAMSLLNKTSVSYTHGDGYSQVIDAYLIYDHFGTFSEKYIEIIKRNKGCIKEYYVCGPPRGDIIYGFNKIKHLDVHYNKLSKKYRIVVAMGIGVYFPAYSHFHNSWIKEYYQTLLSLLNIHEDVYIIVKLINSRDLYQYNKCSVLKDLFENNVNHPRLELSWEEDVYKLISMGEIIIVYNSSTTGIEALTARKKVLYYDFFQNPYHNFKEFGIVATSKKQLINKFNSIYNGNENINWEKIRKEICIGVFDGKCRKRIRTKILELIK